MGIAVPILLFVGFLAFIGAMIAIGYYREKKRTEAFGKIAESLNLEFLPKGSAPLLRELAVFRLFGLGHARQMKNLLQGQAQGLDIDIFDYKYTIGSGKHQQTFSQSVFVARAVGMKLPHFTLRPETFWHRVGGLLGYKDIDFDTHPVFSKKYLLKGHDEESVRAVFPAAVLEYFEATKGLSVEGDGELLAYYRSVRFKPEQIRDFMAEGFEVLKLLERSKKE